MSLSYSDTTNKSGIIQHLERTLGFNDGDISGNTTRLAQFTADINLALDEVYSIIFAAGGRWQFDDSNHSGYPILTADVVSSQQDYSFTDDDQGNLILDIYKVQYKTSSGDFKTLEPRDQQEIGTDRDNFQLSDTGTPVEYDKTANGIFLRPIPNENVTGGLKIFVNREGSYFATSDTTKTPGFAGLFHRYLVFNPAYHYAFNNQMRNRDELREEKARMEQMIREHYGKRQRDEKRYMRPFVTNTR